MKEKSPKQRLDLFLFAKGLVESRQKAQGLILAGKILVNDQKISKSGFLVSESDNIKLCEIPRFVSRGGEKIAGAFESFPWLKDWISNRIIMDLGASTGGFTDFFLQNSVSLVYALDVGYGQLHPRLAVDSRVRILDRMNARLLDKDLFPAAYLPEFFSMDLSFISATKVLPVIKKVFSCIPGLVLVKPQFELDRAKNIKGIVRDFSERLNAVRKVSQSALELGWQISGIDSSVILGPKGNQEFWLLLSNPGMRSINLPIFSDMESLEKEIIKIKKL